jgi:hypothetical protein
MKVLKPKHYLNKRLKPKVVGSVKTYPVYFRFTIGNSNHQIKSYLIGNLKNADELTNYEREVNLESEVLNYLYNRFQDYSFTNFNSDAFYLCSPIHVIVDLYLSTYVDEFEDEGFTVYKKELSSFLMSKTNFPKHFLTKMIDCVDFDSQIPTDFIKEKKLKLIIDTYNFTILYNEYNSTLLCMYNWLKTDIKDDFSQLFSSNHAKVLDKIVKLYYKSFNSPI